MKAERMRGKKLNAKSYSEKGIIQGNLKNLEY